MRMRIGLGRETGRGFMNLFFILLLIYLVFFHTNYLPLNDIVALGTLVSLNLCYLFHGVFLNLFL